MLLKPIVIKKKGTGVWKPSRVEITEGFICHVKIAGEIKPSLERRRSKLATYGLTLQPTPILVGEDFASLEKCYVAVDDVFYEVPTPLKAVDVAFSIIHALNACYPSEAEQVWLIIQRCVYELTTPYDKKIIGVNTLVADINNFE
ncbi:hypothetical protein PPYR_09710 [Photinus pyralis]|uniref:Uncharacterized protein n=1 Tax=Photinus pyralis TaxID=7054 RepID=A0A5N4AN19_PHOPY|nr:hypothetical protein PPYR_09710 [Photinus pyralis]